MNEIAFFKVFRCFHLFTVSSTVDIFLAFPVLLYKCKINDFYRFSVFSKLEKVGSATKLALMFIISCFIFFISPFHFNKKSD